VLGAVVVVGTVGAGTTVGAQPAPPAAGDGAGRAVAVPPADNVFPVPLPYEVAFDDTWHACRDGCRRQHQGNDLMADEGTPAVAVEAGEVVRVDNTDDGNGGLSLWLLGDSGVAYYYAHNSVNLATPGQRVARGQMIARVGRTGNARTTAPHIHFQINLCGETSSDEPCTVDPHEYLLGWAQGLVDGGADGVGWYQASTGAFGQRTEVGSPLSSFPFGTPGTPGVVPVAGDWDGDGRDSVGLYQRSDATFHLRDDEGAALAPVPFGEPGRSDVWPIAGDFDGDGRDTVGLYRQAEAVFVVLVGEGAESPPVALGTPGRPDALPVVGDWDGDGRDAVGVYHQADASLLWLDDESVALPPTNAVVAGAAVYPVAGDWDGDGRDTVGVLNRDAGGAPVFDLPVATRADPAGRRTIAVDGGTDVLPVVGDWNGRDLVTLDELRHIFGAVADEPKVAEGLPALNAAMLQAGISTPARKAAFLATLRSESGFRYDAIEAGNERRYRGRGFIQLTGEGNYRAAGDDLGLDLVGNPDLAINGLASPAIAAWYWTVARDINTAADALDMAAVNYAIGFQPSLRRDMLRCSDFLAALRYYTGEPATDGVNCERTPESRRLGLTPGAPAGGGTSHGRVRDGVRAPSGSVASPAPSIPPGWAPPSPGTTVPPEPATTTTTKPPTSSTTVPVPPPTRPPSTRPPTTGTPTSPPTTGTPTNPPTTAPPTTGTPTSPPTTSAPPTTTPTAAPPTTDGSTTTAPPTTAGSTTAPESTTTVPETTTTTSPPPSSTSAP
jgi:hypothetical protein